MTLFVVFGLAFFLYYLGIIVIPVLALCAYFAYKNESLVTSKVCFVLTIVWIIIVVLIRSLFSFMF